MSIELTDQWITDVLAPVPNYDQFAGVSKKVEYKREFIVPDSCSACERPVVDWENAAAKIKRFKQADIDREVLKMAEIASSICFVRQLIQKIDELEKEIERLRNER